MTWSEFRQLITESFDSEELRTLCFDLDVDYDSLRGEGKEARVRELVAYLRRRRRLPDLVAALSARRSDLPWADILARKRRVPDLIAERDPRLIGAVALLLLLLGVLLVLLLRNAGVFSSPERVARGEYHVTYPKTLVAGTSGVVSLAIGLPMELASLDVGASQSDLFGPSISRLAASELAQPVVRKLGSDAGPMEISENMRAELDGFEEGGSGPIARAVDIQVAGRPARWQWNVVAPTVLGLHTFTLRIYRGSDPNPWERSYEYQVVDYAAEFVRTQGMAQVHAGPSVDAPVVAELPANTIVQPVGRDDAGDWLQVAYGDAYDRTGWLLAATTDVQDALSLPITSALRPTNTPRPTSAVDITPTPTLTPVLPTLTPTPSSASPTPMPTHTPMLTPSPTSTPRATATGTGGTLPETGGGPGPGVIALPALVASLGLALFLLGALARRRTA
jgi:hypothetical protein